MMQRAPCQEAVNYCTSAPKELSGTRGVYLRALMAVEAKNSPPSQVRAFGLSNRSRDSRSEVNRPHCAASRPADALGSQVRSRTHLAEKGGAVLMIPVESHRRRWNVVRGTELGDSERDPSRMVIPRCTLPSHPSVACW